RVSRLQEVAARSHRPAQAGLDVTAFAGGYWIELGGLSSEAAKVVDSVRARQATLRAAPMAVIDLRGNSGGNSQYALEIAQALVGNQRVAAADRPQSNCSGAYWRVSSDNLAALRKFVSGLPDDRKSEWQAQANDMAEAL